MFARVAILTAAIALLGFAGSAAAQPPVGPCNGPNQPWFCGPDDRISISTEPAGENCAAGGLKVVVQNGRRDDAPKLTEADPAPAGPPVEPGAVPVAEDPGIPVVVTEPEKVRPPRPDPPDEVFYVCNGLPGATGPAGPQGPAGPAGPVVTVPVQPKVCQSSTRIGVRLFLPPRLARFGVVRLQIAKVNGPLRFNANVRVRVPRSQPNGPRFVFVPIRNRNCGAYVASVGRGSVEPIVQVWNITGRFGLKRTTITG